jgi:ATP synthase F1 complex assembly factor 1
MGFWRVNSNADYRQGLKDIKDLKDAYKQKIESLRKQALVPGATAPINPQVEGINASAFPPGPPPPPQSSTAESPTAPPPTSSDSSAPPGVKTLSSYLDIPKTLELPQKEIEYLWRLRHATKENSLHFTIPGDVYAHIALNGRKHPQFILPLPRENQGAEIHFLQWTFPHPDTVNILFTHLAEYKLRGEYASPHTTISLHTELLGPKELVLGQGSVMDGKGITVDEAKWLIMCLQKFYGLPSSVRGIERKRLLEMFSNGDESFKVEQLLEEAERIG